MDFFNALRGLKKSQSGPNLSFSERLSLSRRSANHGKQRRDDGGLSSPLPPRPPSRNGGAATTAGKGSSGRVIENIPENRVVEPRKGGGGGGNSTYVTPQELRIQGLYITENCVFLLCVAKCPAVLIKVLMCNMILHHTRFFCYLHHHHYTHLSPLKHTHTLFPIETYTGISFN